MNKKYVVSTLIKRNHKFGENAYVRGRISGIKLVVCDGSDKFANCEIDEGILIKSECTPEQYDEFMNIVEKHYPGLCEFDYKLKQESE